MNIVAELHQKAFTKGKRSFILYEDGTVDATYRQGFQRTNFSVNARLLEPTPIRQEHKALSMKTGAYLLGMFVFACAVAAVNLREYQQARIIFTFLACFLLIPYLVCQWEYRRQSFQAVIFFSPVTDNTLVLMDGLPSRDTFEQFVKTLSDTIFRLRQKWDTTSPSQVIDRVKELAAMREEGMITEDEFNKLKQDIIAAQQPGDSIGFK